MSNNIMSYWENELTQIRRPTAPEPPKPRIVFDSTAEDYAPELAGDAEAAQLCRDVVASINQWAETDDLAPSETYTTRLLALLIGLVDDNKDGEVGADEEEYLNIALNCAYDYLTSKGASEADASALLEDMDDDAGDRVRDMIAANLPEGMDNEAAEMEAYVFGTDGQEAMFDSCGEKGKKVAMDAAYRRVFAVRGGKRVALKKRIGHFVMSAAQKLAIRKARMKSNTTAAKLRRLRSFGMRKKVGLK